MKKDHLPAGHASRTEKPTNLIARRTFLERTATFLVTAGIAAGGLARAKAAEKYDKVDVAWQNSPKDGQSCANCRFWDGVGGCEIVAGEFAPDDWCAVWVEA